MLLIEGVREEDAQDIRCGREDNIKTNSKVIGCENIKWSHLA
jgi:hypothetical protein